MEDTKRYWDVLYSAARMGFDTKEERVKIVNRVRESLTLDKSTKKPSAASTEVALDMCKIRGDTTKDPSVVAKEAAAYLGFLSQGCYRSEIDNGHTHPSNQATQRWQAQELYSIAALTFLDVPVLWTWQTSRDPDIVKTRTRIPWDKITETAKEYRSRCTAASSQMQTHERATNIAEYAKKMHSAISGGQTALPLVWPKTGLPRCLDPLGVGRSRGLPEAMKTALKSSLEVLDLKWSGDLVRKLRSDSLAAFPPHSSMTAKDMEEDSPSYTAGHGSGNLDDDAEMVDTEMLSDGSNDESDYDEDSPNLVQMAKAFAMSSKDRQKEGIEYYLQEAEDRWADHKMNPNTESLVDLWKTRIELGVFIELSLTDAKASAIDVDRLAKIERGEPSKVTSLLDGTVKIMTAESPISGSEWVRAITAQESGREARDDWWAHPQERLKLRLPDYLAEMDRRKLSGLGWSQESDDERALTEYLDDVDDKDLGLDFGF